MPTRRDFTRSSMAALGALSLGHFPATTELPNPTLRVNGERLNRHLADLSQFGRNPQGGVTRLAYSPADLKGRELASGLMRSAGLSVRIDAAGNLLGRRAGRDPGRRPIMFGSHIDSVPEGGNFDGPVGSLGAIEVAQTLGEAGITTRHPIEVVIFQNEEGGTFGSRAITGELGPNELDHVAQSGKSIREGIALVGGSVESLSAGDALRRKGDVAAYVELHIEQGGNLDQRNLDIGVVEGIVGISRWDVTVEGFANHAGTTAMNNRRDAMLAFARFADMVNRVVTSVPGRQVGTIGRVAVTPDAPNVIPGKVVCSLELRDLDKAKTASLFDRIQTEARQIAAGTGTTFSYALLHDSTPALTDPRIQTTVEKMAKGLGLSMLYLPSGAGHDAQHMAHICPAGMIFVPSVGGISHAPKEFTEAADITHGANVLLQTVLALDGMEWA
jgi:N-carbamoyl-L-amino-acid hydrolase